MCARRWGERSRGAADKGRERLAAPPTARSRRSVSAGDGGRTNEMVRRGDRGAEAGGSAT